MRRLLRALPVVLAVLTVLSGVLAWLLRPPKLAVPERGFVLSGVTLVEPEGTRRRGHVIRGDDRIRELTPAPPGSGDARYAGSFVLPGLVDAHVHHPPVVAVGERELFALLFLRFGVTTVRDTGSALPSVLGRHARAVASGRLAGPRTLRCGPWLDGDPPVWPGARVVRDQAAAEAVVAELARSGVDCLKIYNELTPGATRGILEAAEQHGLPVVAHVPWGLPIELLPGAEVQHLMGLSLNWSGVSDAVVARYVAQSKQFGISHTPTLAPFARLRDLESALRSGAEPQHGRYAELLPRYHREVLWHPRRNVLMQAQMGMPGRLEAMRIAVRELHAAGVPVIAGTDTMNPGLVPGAALQEELHELAWAGLGPEGAWSAATWRAGQALGIADLGRLRVGAPADLLVFARDPTRDLDALDSLLAVVADGRLYPVEVLDEALDRARAHFGGWPYEPLSLALASAGIDWLAGSDGTP